MQGEAGGFFSGYDVNLHGVVTIPVIGQLSVGGLTLEETKKILQAAIDKVFNNSTIECKLLSFKFTVLCEVRSPGTYFNFNNYLSFGSGIKPYNYLINVRFDCYSPNKSIRYYHIINY